MPAESCPPYRILLADDGSQHAQAAIQTLCTLPLPAGTAITAVSIFTPLQTSEHEKLRQSLELTRKCLSQSGITVISEMVLGYPAEKLIEFADRFNPDLIVMGAKGLRATLGILLGGVAQQVVEYANWPVLIVRAPYKPLRRILVAIDGSAYSHKSLDYLSCFPLPEDIELYLINVLSPPPVAIEAVPVWPPIPEMVIPPPLMKDEDIENLLSEQEAAGHKLLEAAVEYLDPLHRPASIILKRGDAATEIIEYVKSNDIDLIVVGSRGLSQVKSWLLGSVSRKLIHYSNCSVLVVKKPA